MALESVTPRSGHELSAVLKRAVRSAEGQARAPPLHRFVASRVWMTWYSQQKGGRRERAATITTGTASPNTRES